MNEYVYMNVPCLVATHSSLTAQRPWFNVL